MDDRVQPISTIDVGALSARLEALANKGEQLSSGPGRMEVLNLIREALDEGRQTARTLLERQGLSGYEVARSLARLEDELIIALFDFTITRVFPQNNRAASERLAVIATGGYGRFTLAPASDIDLMFLFPYKLTPWVESVVEYILYMLWDLGQTVGHATRSVDESIRLSTSDYMIRTTLLEARFIRGDREIFDTLMDQFHQQILKGNSADFIEAKLLERDDRHRRAGESRYLVEPNIKDGKGGLRDLHTLYWIGKHVYRVNDPADFVEVGLLTQTEYDTFANAEDFLWSVRCHLHFMAGRPEEKLTFDRQVEMASRMGYATSFGQRAVEHFMSDYFRVAKDVGDLTRIICAGLELNEQKFWPTLGEFFRAGGRKDVGAPGFVIERGRMTMTSETVFKDDPVNFLRLFELADRHRSKIHPDLLTLVTRSLHLIDDDLRNDPEANKIFIEILTSKRDPERALRSMNEAGVLGAFIPDFGNVVALMQFNMYHHYTVDEHTIRCIGHLSKIERGEAADELPLSDKIIHQVQHRDALYVAMMMHDLAKAYPGDHSILGAEMSRALCPRLGLSTAETDTVAWLVEYHLYMSDVAQRRDLSDPKTIEACAQLIQSPERLRMLLCLTVADIRGVGPGVWNGWKGELLRQLYFEVEAMLQGGHSAVLRPDVVHHKKAALDDRLKGWKDKEKAAMLDNFEDAYWRGLDTDTHIRHADLLRRVFDEGKEGSVAYVTSAPDTFRDVTQVSIYANDRPGLFSLLAGAITRSGGTIADAKAFTGIDGKAMDVFWVQDAEDTAYDDVHRLARLEALVNQTLNDGAVDASQFANPLSRVRQQAFSISPQVIVDNTASSNSTMIEVNGLDRPGLLYDLSHTLMELKLSISSAHVATYGERAIDVFYVKDQYGLKITHSVRLDKIKKALLDVL